MNRNESRNAIMVILYQAFIYDRGNIKYDIKDLINENVKIKNGFVETMVYGILNNIDSIRSIANKYLNDWKITRLGLTDQAILCMGIYELLYTDTPSIIAINEAIELSKKYSDDKVKNTINAVLDSVYHKEKKED